MRFTVRSALAGSCRGSVFVGDPTRHRLVDLDKLDKLDKLL
jgi:hypothetical protein